MTEQEKDWKRFLEWLHGDLRDFAGVTALRAFCRLFTARCLDTVHDGRQMRYRRRAGITLYELEPAERILLECAKHFSRVTDLLSAAAKRIRHEIPNSKRSITLEDAETFAEIQTGITEALHYQPPASSCSV